MLGRASAPIEYGEVLYDQGQTAAFVVVSGELKRVASAVDEVSIAISFVHRVLQE